MIAGRVSVTISKTADGKGDYLQLMSEDMLSLNVVVVALKIEVKDTRPPKRDAAYGPRPESPIEAALDAAGFRRKSPRAVAENTGDIRRKGTSPIIGREGLERAIRGKR